MENKSINKAFREKQELARSYGVPVSTVIWIGNNHYIVVKDGTEIRI